MFSQRPQSQRANPLLRQPASFQSGLPKNRQAECSLSVLDPGLATVNFRIVCQNPHQFLLSHSRLVLCSLDLCVWPSNSSYVQNCLSSFAQILAMAPLHVGHCQVPVMQKQTTTEAWIKHKRALEDSLKKSRMDVTQHVALSFDKSGSHANDRRSVLHQCLFVTALDREQNAWSSCAAATKGVIGPCPLMRVSDMVGFDPDNRFGAASRTEQRLSAMPDRVVFLCPHQVKWPFAWYCTQST